MAVWKKLNPETGEYEPIENAESSNGSSNLVKVEDLKLELEVEHGSSTIPTFVISNPSYVERYEYLYLLVEHYADYAFNASSTSLNGTGASGLWSAQTVTVNDKKYYLLTIDCSAIRTALNGSSFESLGINATNVSARWSGNEKAWLSSAYSEELFLRDFVSVEVTDAFVFAVDEALERSNSIDSLNGKTVIFMGDSYTAGAKSNFEALCAKHGAIADNRGIVSSSICGDETGSKGFQPMHRRTSSVCDEYVANGTTGNVGAVVFMGGANDGFGSTTWLGTGTNDKDTNHIYGAMHSILKAFRNTFDCPIFVILQPYFPNGITPDAEADDETAKTLGFESAEQMLTFDADEYAAYSMQKKQRIVKEMAEFYNCHIVDCCFEWHSIFNASDRAKYWSGDGHPTGKGYQAIADDLEAKMIEVMG